METTAVEEFVPLRSELGPVGRFKSVVWGGAWLVAMALVDDREEALIYLVVTTVMHLLMDLLPMREGMRRSSPCRPVPSWAPSG